MHQNNVELFYVISHIFYKLLLRNLSWNLSGNINYSNKVCKILNVQYFTQEHPQENVTFWLISQGKKIKHLKCTEHFVE